MWMVFIMTIKELFNANVNMSYGDICVLHCRFDNSCCGKSTDGIIGCIIYEDYYGTMPEALKDLKVKTFESLSHTGLPHEPNKWDIWVV